jgi:hypothetical protein
MPVLCDGSRLNQEISMSIHFKEVTIKNTNSITLTLTLEAPIGTPLGKSWEIPADGTRTIDPGVSDCPSVLLAIKDSAHTETKQTFGLSSPQHGRPTFLESVVVVYNIGNFNGSVQAHTSQ